MNRAQRERNRLTAERLARANKARRLASYTCENCGGKGGHWVETRSLSLKALVEGRDDREGYWLCDQAKSQEGSA